MDSSLQLSISPTAHTGAAVRALRAARGLVPHEGSLLALLDAADPDWELHPDAYAEAAHALDVGARVFGFDAAAQVSADQRDATAVVDVAVYHLTGAPGDLGPALAAFRRAAGPLLERH